MQTVLDRYIFREVLQSWLAVTAVLLAILMANQFARILGEAAAGALPREAVFTLVALAGVDFLITLVPVGLFLAVMIAFGRLYRDSEMAAMMGCGVGVRRAFRPIFKLGFLVTALTAYLALQVGPWAEATSADLRTSARQEAQFGSFDAGRFKVTQGGEGVFYSERTDDALERMEIVFLARNLGDRIEVVYAPEAEQITDGTTGERLLVMREGHRYIGVPGEAGFVSATFEEHGLPVRVEGQRPARVRTEALPTSALLGSDDPEERAQLQWRLSTPISVLVLLVLAMPLSRSAPRQGRYGRIIVAILAYFVYSNLLGSSEVWLEKDRIPAWLGMWWVHLLALIVGGLLLAQQLGFRWSFERLTGRRAA